MNLQRLAKCNIYRKKKKRKKEKKEIKTLAKVPRLNIKQIKPMSSKWNNQMQKVWPIPLKTSLD